MIRRSTNQLSIKPKVSPVARLALLLGALFVAGLVVIFAYKHGVASGNAQYKEDRDLVSQLNSTMNDLRAELASSKENLTIAERHKQIQEEAYKQISSAYASSEQKNRYLGSRLDFYRSIISPEDGKSGPAIQSLTLANETEGLKFDVTLVQAIRHKHQVKGSLQVEYYDQQTLLASWPERSSRSLSFQYFQQVGGVFENAKPVETPRFRVIFKLQDGEVLERWFEGINPV